MLKMTALAKGVANPLVKFIPFNRGLDQVTPELDQKPGAMRDCLNYEIDINGGYVMGTGYERFDGRPAPSEAIYYILEVTISGTIVAGNTVTGATSAATGYVVAVNTTYDEDQAFLVLTKLTGTFVDGENLTVAAVVQANTDSTADASAAPTLQLNAFYRNMAADVYRADIGPVPGEGKIRGVWCLGDTVYAVRNNMGSSAAVIHKSTVGGWSAIALGRELAFTSGGPYVIAEGNVITGATSGATATVTRVVLQSGSWGAGTAAGRLIFASQTGVFVAENLDVVANTDVATIAANSSAITLLPNGRYETVVENFGGQLGTLRVYGVDKANRGFEFDGTVFVPIVTGMTVDVPTHVEVFKKHLFFSFAASAQHSGTGTPYIWSPIFGAAELAVGDTITSFEVLPGSDGGEGSLAILCRNRTNILYGSSTLNWNLVKYRREVGAYEYTVQECGLTLLYDDRGIANLATTQAFANFKSDSVSQQIQPYLNQRRSTATDSCICRDKSQYRIFFADKSALYVTLKDNKVMGMTSQLFADKVECSISQENSDGTEAMYFGSDDGYVYQMERGTSHDGDAIERRFTLHYFHAGSPRMIKKWLDAAIEIKGTGYSEFYFSFLIGYALPGVPQPDHQQQLVLAEFTAAQWDSFVWDNFIWDGVYLSPLTKKLEGSAENIALIIRSTSDYFFPLTFSGSHVRFTNRRQMRS